MLFNFFKLNIYKSHTLCGSLYGFLVSSAILFYVRILFDEFAGVDNDETIKMSRSGGADPDGNQPGDLYVTIKVKLTLA